MALQNYVTIHARLVYADLLVDRQYLSKLWLVCVLYMQRVSYTYRLINLFIYSNIYFGSKGKYL